MEGIAETLWFFEKVFAGLQTEGMIEIKVQIVCLDSTIVKVHPDACGALKKMENKQWEEAEADSPQKFIWLPRLQRGLNAAKCR